jgi:hypothetical protein
MYERSLLAIEMAELGLRLRERQVAAPFPPLPQVMFEFDVHYGFRDEIDRRLGQNVGWDSRLTTQVRKRDFFNIKRDIDRLEIGTKRFSLDAAGLGEIDQAKRNIKAYADALQAGCRLAKPRTDISITDADGRAVRGHPRLFPLPSALNSGVLVHKLHSRRVFPDNCRVWASPQAHMTIPLGKVPDLIAAIEKSISGPRSRVLTGSGSDRMGLKSDHLFRAKRGVERALAAHDLRLRNGAPVSGAALTQPLRGFLMLVVSYLWVTKLWQPRDKEGFGKGHLPINVKTPFPDIFRTILTPAEQRIYSEVFADAAVRARLYGIVERVPLVAHGTNKLFPDPVGSSATWDDLIDWTLARRSPFAGGLPGGGNPWQVAETAPLVALELRRIGHRAWYSSEWAELIDTVVGLTRRLNQ